MNDKVVKPLTLNVATIDPKVNPHTLTVLSSDPDATNKLFGAKQMLVIAPL